MLESAAFSHLHHAEHVSLRLVMTSDLSSDVSLYASLLLTFLPLLLVLLADMTLAVTF